MASKFQMTTTQYKNLLQCQEEINQIDNEIEIAKQCKIDCPTILIDTLTEMRERIFRYCKHYAPKSGKEILTHGK